MPFRGIPLGSDKRRACRYRCSGDVLLYSQTAGRRVTGEIFDLSLSGCLVRPHESNSFREEEFVDISFCLHNFTVVAKGRVRNIRPDQSFGIEFTTVADRYRGNLQALLEQLARQWIASGR